MGCLVEKPKVRKERDLVDLGSSKCGENQGIRE